MESYDKTRLSTKTAIGLVVVMVMIISKASSHDLRRRDVAFSAKESDAIPTCRGNQTCKDKKLKCRAGICMAKKAYPCKGSNHVNNCLGNMRCGVTCPCCEERIRKCDMYIHIGYSCPVTVVLVLTVFVGALTLSGTCFYIVLEYF